MYKNKNNNKIILIFLVAFAAISVLTILWVKLPDIKNYYSKENGTNVGEQSDSGEPVDFQGIILNIDKNRKNISFRGINLGENKQTDLDLLIDDSTEINLSESQEKISFDDLLVTDPISLSAAENVDGSWSAKKIKVIQINTVSGKVTNVEKNKLIVIRDLDESESNVIYGVSINSKTKIFIKDYSNAIQQENKTVDAGKVVEKEGNQNDLKTDSFVIISSDKGSIPRKSGEFMASKIEIIINQ